jgi:hypothetical protein
MADFRKISRFAGCAPAAFSSGISPNFIRTDLSTLGPDRYPAIYVYNAPVVATSSPDKRADRTIIFVSPRSSAAIELLTIAD